MGSASCLMQRLALSAIVGKEASKDAMFDRLGGASGPPWRAGIWALAPALTLSMDNASSGGRWFRRPTMIAVAVESALLPRRSWGKADTDEQDQPARSKRRPSVLAPFERSPYRDERHLIVAPHSVEFRASSKLSLRAAESTTPPLGRCCKL